MTDNEITTMRTELANKFAEAGAAFLDFTGTGSALAPIEGTNPQQYAAAGTLETIRRIWPKDEVAATVLTDERIDLNALADKFSKQPSDGSHQYVTGWNECVASMTSYLAHAGKAEAPAAAGIEGLWRYRPDYCDAGVMHREHGGEYVKFADVERLLAQAGVTAEPVAWMNPETLDVIHDARKRAWENDFGLGGKAKAAGYTYRLVAHAQVPAAEVRAAYKQAAQIALKLTRVPRDLLGPATPQMKVTARIGEKIAEQILSLAQQSTADKASEVRAAEWISVADERKPVGRSVILVAVNYVRYGEYEDGTPGEHHGYVVAEGEYVPKHGEVGDYFTCFSSPHGDSESITHWMPLPAAPSTADSAGTGAMGEGAEA